MSETPFAVTDSAAKRIAFLAAKEAKPVMMRVAVLGGGCSGFQYNFSFEDQRNDDDLVIERDGAAGLGDSTPLAAPHELQRGAVDRARGAVTLDHQVVVVALVLEREVVLEARTTAAQDGHPHHDGLGFLGGQEGDALGGAVGYGKGGLAHVLQDVVGRPVRQCFALRSSCSR